jgi:hypothetical protein
VAAGDQIADGVEVVPRGGLREGQGRHRPVAAGGDERRAHAHEQHEASHAILLEGQSITEDFVMQR